MTRKKNAIWLILYWTIYTRKRVNFNFHYWRICSLPKLYYFFLFFFLLLSILFIFWYHFTLIMCTVIRKKWQFSQVVSLILSARLCLRFTFEFLNLRKLLRNQMNNEKIKKIVSSLATFRYQQLLWFSLLCKSKMLFQTYTSKIYPNRTKWK